MKLLFKRVRLFYIGVLLTISGYIFLFTNPLISPLDFREETVYGFLIVYGPTLIFTILGIDHLRHERFIAFSGYFIALVATGLIQRLIILSYENNSDNYGVGLVIIFPIFSGLVYFVCVGIASRIQRRSRD